MKKFSNLKTTLFDSTSASFRMTIEGVFIKKNPTGNYSDLVYVSDQGNGSLNPNIYLTISNKAEGAKALYTSYPQLPKFRHTMGEIADLLESGEAFADYDGILTVKSAHANPHIISNIGKQKRWVSFKLVTVESGDNGVVTAIPGVSIEISDENNTSYTSVLTDDEFLTVYHIIKDINLPQIQISMSLAFLAADGSSQSGMMPSMPMNTGYMAPQPRYNNGYQNNGGGYYQNNYQGQPQQNGYAPRQPQQPRYANNNMGRQAAPVRQASSPVISSQPMDNQSESYGSPMTPAPSAQSTHLPPRQEKPIVNMKAVEDVPVSNVDFDDLGAIDDILNGNV